MPTLPGPGERSVPRFGGVARVEAPEINRESNAILRLSGEIAGLGEALAKKKVADDRYRAEDATTKLQNRMLDLSKGENGYTNYKSGDVANNDKFFEEHMSRYDNAQKEIIDSLGNDEQRALVANRGAVARIGYAESLINHITKEKDVFNQEVYEGGVAVERDLAASNYDNENAVKNNILRTRKLTESELERKGIKGDARKILLKSNESDIHESVIRQAVDDGNYEYAKSWFEKNQKNILGEKQDDIKDLLREGGIKERSIEAVDSFVSQGLTEAQAKAEARKLDPELRDATNARIEERYADAGQIREREQRAAGDAAWQIYEETLSIDTIPLSILRGMDGRDRSALRERARLDAKGEKRTTDWDKWDEFESLLESGEITDVSQVRRFELYFSDRDMRNAVKKFEKRGEISTTDLQRSFIDNLGKPRSKWSESEKEQWLSFQDYMLDKVKETRRPEDLSVWADRWFMSGENVETFFWTDDPDTLGQAITAGRADDFFLDIPEDDVSNVDQVMTDLGETLDKKQFYSNLYLPAVDYLRAHDIPINNRTITAVAALRRNNKPVTRANIDYVAGQVTNAR